MTKRETYISRQAKRLSKGQIDRRRFVMSALATGVTMPTAMSLASRAEAMAPRRGGLLRFGMADGYSTDRPDPATTMSEMMRVANLARANGLVTRAPDGQITGDLAASIQSENAGKTWVFDLRTDVHFHSGKPLTSKDVLATFHHALKHSPATRGALSEIADIQSDGPSRVIVHLHHPHLRFPALLDLPQLVILPSRDGAVDPASGDGTGPYRLTSVQPGVEVTMSRAPDHWRADRGYFDEVILRALPKPGQRPSAMMTGEVDAIDQVDPRALAMLSNLPEIGIHKTPGTRHLAITLPFSDPHLRQALKFAIDRRAILDTAYLGHGSLGADIPIPAASDHDAPAFDPDRAAWHWRKSGIKGAMPLAISGVGDPSVRLAAELFRTSAKTAGIELLPSKSLAPNSQPAILARMRRNHACEDAAYAATCMPGSETCDTGRHSGHKTTAIQTAVRAARASEDDSAYLATARRLLSQNGDEILPVWPDDHYAHSARLALPTANRLESADIVLGGWFR